MAFHLKLINRNETTNEFLKGRGNARNYSLREGSACKRFLRVWCYRKPPSLITNDLIRQSLFIEKIVDKEDWKDDPVQNIASEDPVEMIPKKK